MNRKIGLGLLIVVIGSLTSCVQDNHGSTTGKMRLRVTANTEVQSMQTRSGAEVLDLDVSEFDITILKGEEEIGYWESLNQFPDEYVIASGSYTLKASYGSLTQEGFDAPYFEGTKDFTVTKDETTQVEVVCSLANVKVTVEYTDAYKEYFSEYSTLVESASGTEIEFAGDEERAAYLQPGNFVVYARVKREGGEFTTIEAAVVEDAKGREHYILKMNVNLGSTSLQVSFDDATERVPVEVDISDEVLSAPAPYFIATGFESGETQTIVEGGYVAGGKTSVLLQALAGISKIQLTTQSEVLKEMGWPEEIELIHASAADLELLKSLGLQLRGVEKNVEKMAVIDFTEVLANLLVTQDNSPAVFTLQATDKLSRVSESEMTLKVLCTSNQLELISTETVALGSQKITASLVLDGDPSLLKFQYQSYGVWSDATSVSVILSDGLNHQVEVTLPSPVFAEIDLRAVYRSKTSNEIPAQTGDPQFEVKALTAGDVWAGKAILTIVGENDAVTAYLRDEHVVVEYCDPQDEGNWITPAQQREGDVITISLPLDADKENTYLVRAGYEKNGNYIYTSSTHPITTEQARQVPNSDLEEWSGNTSVTSNWTRWYLNTEEDETIPGWCSLNAITSQGRKTNAYQSNSGTRRTTSNFGTYAAELVTIGWGDNNALPIALISPAGKLENITAAELFLGTMGADNQPQYGYEFTSRPAALSFYYNYQGVGSQKFSVDIKVMSGNIVIGEQFLEEGSNSAYEQKTIEIVYHEQYASLKATHLSIAFSSGLNSLDQMDMPSSGFTGNASKEFTGNKLYLDDIKLEY
ncbi:MAG: DUF4493 domain-containing protein [Bacteroides sp.]|nr:DUF4493 domain-containing protein [Bacteroides sp.]